MVDNLLIAVYAFSMHMLILLSVNEMLFPRYVKWSTNFIVLSFNVEMAPSCLNRINSVLSEFKEGPMLLDGHSRLYSWDSA